MKSFKNNPHDEPNETIMGKLSRNLTKTHRKIADFLNEKASFLTRRTLLLILILYALVHGGYCLHLIFNSFF